MRSQSPDIRGPTTLKIYVNQFNINQGFTTIQQAKDDTHERLPKVNGDVFSNRNRGFMSPQPRQSKINNDFSTSIGRIESPIQPNNLTINKQKVNTFILSPAKGNLFSLY